MNSGSRSAVAWLWSMNAAVCAAELDGEAGAREDVVAQVVHEVLGRAVLGGGGRDHGDHGGVAARGERRLGDRGDAGLLAQRGGERGHLLLVAGAVRAGAATSSGPFAPGPKPWATRS